MINKCKKTSDSDYTHDLIAAGALYRHIVCYCPGLRQSPVGPRGFPTSPRTLSGRIRSDPCPRVVEFGTDRVRLCRWSGLVVSFPNSTTRTYGLCLPPDQTRPTNRVRTCRDWADKSTTGQSPRTCRRPSGSWVWSGRVHVVEFTNDTTRPDQRQIAKPV